ncbi:MAG: electron transport complex subunit RsxC [Candidatus Cryptobacteroides sp.]|nr:electron transport complex subunit RsxC [Bacteroidales bacterium]MDD7531598.1 electron transport complex subunit RsxC [Bacteroidales bacterium]MDY2858966.1 electron transport complex subunit RsxC [Candidatus Cryptobacteroides sp.]MDY4630529.1 electron transport complex subunit RsxC [Candidatus Cryptobacteroides sp.]MDY5743828.1 electron transport complex subunit RsxC [Candidatus Cryptobacteroides sp.]
MKKTFRIGGVHPDDNKISRNCEIEVLPLPQTVYISMAQHLGAPAKPIVAVGDKVKAGQPIAEPGGFISAWVHSSVSGTVKSIAPRKDISGNYMTHIEIAVEGDEWAEGIDLSDTLVTDIPSDRAAVLAKIQACGVVGLGGATFPTHVKLNPAPGSVAECLILNGAECEPFLTSDNRIMIERSREIVVGAAIMKMVLGNCPAVIAIEENKPEAIKAMSEAVSELGYSGIEVMTLKKKYPQGGEKQLINAVMRREVKSGGLPISAGAVVQNVATSLAVYEAVQKNKPLVTNTMTITGDCLDPEAQHNYLFRIGMPLSYIAQYAGGVPEKCAKIVSGGPMMGKAISNMDACTVKGSSSLLYLSSAFTKRGEASYCIRCGKCADACPMGLEPFLLNKLAKHGRMDELEANAIQDCISCGCCQYTCPANIPLLDTINIAKGDVMRIIKSRPKN